MRDFNLVDSTLFGKEITKEEIIQELHRKVPKDGLHYRVRLLVSVYSIIEIEYTKLLVPAILYESLEKVAETKPYCCVVLDKQAFSEKLNDYFILHKTTKRGMYNEARERTGCDWHATSDQPFDVILWNPRGDITESSIANIAVRFDQDGKHIWKTPKIECGVLPGVFRSFLLSSGQNIIQDTITIEELRQADKDERPIVCFNSVRKLYRVQLLSDINK